MSKVNRFQRGSGCYTCKSCGKRTRATGGNDNEHCLLCVACYDYAGWENTHSDYGHADKPDPDCPVCRGEPDPASSARADG